MRQVPRQKRAELQRLNSISNLRNKQLAGHSFCKKTSATDEPDRIEHYDLELRPTKLHELKLGEVLNSGDGMVSGFLDAITKARHFRLNNDDDFIDRLSRRYSVVLFMLFTVVVSSKQYVGDRKQITQKI